LGWTEGRNVRVDLRWGGDDIDRMRALAQELVGLQPDLILTQSDRSHPAGDADDPASQQPFRVIPSKLWAVDLSLANMDYEEFADAVDAEGIFRGFS
jgi:hypothetical protein